MSFGCASGFLVVYRDLRSLPRLSKDLWGGGGFVASSDAFAKKDLQTARVPPETLNPKPLNP